MLAQGSREMKPLYILISFFTLSLYADVELEAIDVSESSVSEDFLGINADKAPLSVKSYSAKVFAENRIKSVNDMTTLDATLTNNYSGSGYWDSLNIRGFAVDNRTNYFRDGLRINAQTLISLENKERVEVIKGLGGFQTSGANPSGSINYKTKRAQEARILKIELTERGGYLAHVDFGEEKEKFNYRLNLVTEEIKSPFDFNDGQRDLMAAAFSYQIDKKTLLEGEIEWNQRSQQSLSAMSFWGNSLPAVDSTSNLNNQSWVKPVEFTSLFYSLKFTQELKDSWILSIASGRQESKTDDRMSYAFGCSAENNWDRFCSDGTFDVYDYRSEDELRITNSAKISLSKFFEGEVSHDLSFNFRYTHQEEKQGFQAYNFSGVGDPSGRELPSNAAKTDPSTNLLEDSFELFVVDHIKFSAWDLWLGGNVQSRYRASFKKDRSEKGKSSDTFLTPWLALSRQWEVGTVYLSYAQGKESWLTPNKISYKEPTKILPQETTHQYELGIKSKNYSSALFYLKRPRLFDDGEDFKISGFYQQLGWENQIHLTYQNTYHDLSFMYLQVKQFASGESGKMAPNIPQLALRYQGKVQIRTVDAGVLVQYESSRFAGIDNELSIPDWIKWDIFVEKKWESYSLRAYVDNIFQKRFWKESPLQYGHHYLYQGAGRRAGILAEYRF